jgi:hypothetical protein
MAGASIGSGPTAARAGFTGGPNTILLTGAAVAQ